jgi:hypothetical protein
VRRGYERSASKLKLTVLLPHGLFESWSPLEFGEEAQTLLRVDGDQLSKKSRKARLFAGPVFRAYISPQPFSDKPHTLILVFNWRNPSIRIRTEIP